MFYLHDRKNYKTKWLVVFLIDKLLVKRETRESDSRI